MLAQAEPRSAVGIFSLFQLISLPSLFIWDMLVHINKVKQLSAKKIAEITLHARLFSQKFFELRKKNELKKIYKFIEKHTVPYVIRK